MRHWTLRPATENDFNFITNSWIESYKGFKDTTFMIFKKYHNPLINKIIKEKAITLMAVDNEHKDLIYGWCCFEHLEKPVLHYLYVKAIYRKTGVAKDLFNTCIKDEFYYTHRTDGSQEIFIQDRHGIYNPYLLKEVLNG